ncbi:MAG: DegT/DnrJ/EryC1/StrS aminotransferase family protein, partial [Candidatus Margulisbacteria bacterium]|nr:DegT/DnrJ/EryC1/StrS aminotransferase family protein [Candidatus Margulisiibacteriota bacterium]
HFIPVHKHPYYKDTFGYKESDYPVANNVFDESLSLPIYPDLDKSDATYIVEMIQRYVS